MFGKDRRRKPWLFMDVEPQFENLGSGFYTGLTPDVVALRGVHRRAPTINSRSTRFPPWGPSSSALVAAPPWGSTPITPISGRSGEWQARAQRRWVGAEIRKYSREQSVLLSHDQAFPIWREKNYVEAGSESSSWCVLCVLRALRVCVPGPVERRGSTNQT